MAVTPMTDVRITDNDGRIFDFHPAGLVTGHVGDTAVDVERWRTRLLPDRTDRAVVGVAAMIALSDRPQGRAPHHLRTSIRDGWWLIEAEYHSKREGK